MSGLPRGPLTEIRVEPYVIPAAELGPENPLPTFRAADPDSAVRPDDSIPSEDRKLLGWRTAYRVLPYRLQDGYGREKRPRAFRSVVLENERLRAIVLPELGGRLASLYHKPSETELLDPVTHFQPANLALRNAWFCSGIEWNTPHFGHHYLTCSPIFAARVNGNDAAPVLRLYAWERTKCFPYQVDLHLPPDSDFLFARVRLVNPHDYELPMYWWTNMGVSQIEGRRVLVPAETAIHNAPNGLALTDVPELEGRDFSYGVNVPYAKEFFFRIPRGRRPWIAYVDQDGRGFAQTSTGRLIGRKMFLFGTNTGGSRWQEFLLGPGRAYLEIQAGLARTQIESVPMPAGEEWCWTEAFGPVVVDPTKAHSTDWEEAWRATEAALQDRLPDSKLDELDRRFAEVAARRPDELLSAGDGWGALERKRAAACNATDRIPQEFVFGVETLGPEQQPWLALLEEGALPTRSTQEEPGEYMIQDEWRALLEDSIREGKGDHWLSWLHLGVMRMEALDAEGAKEAWLRSLDREPSAWALRNLSALEARNGNLAEATNLMLEAWETGPHIAALALECADLLLRTEEFERLRDFVGSLPAEVRRHERMLIVLAKLALHFGDLAGVEEILDHEFATVREGEVTLTDLWFAVQARRIAEAEGVPLDDDLHRRVRRELEPPRRLDFRMAG